MPEIGGRAPLDCSPALVCELVERRVEIDFIGKLAGDSGAVSVHQVISHQIEPESERIFKRFGTMTLGELTQASAAFVTLQMAFNWLVDNFQRISDWRAATNRVAALLSAIDQVESGHDV
jgi:ABC-type uncharacterized transport system fused permease/ATPase subunit